jgi:transcription initiation factor TFIIIB Brf1 subunit/transcription initiation factor TFIIB
MNNLSEYKKQSNKLNYSEAVYIKANNLFFVIKQGTYGYEDYAPGFFYIAGLLLGERRTQKEVADVFKISTVTLRKQYRELKSIFTELKLIDWCY